MNHLHRHCLTEAERRRVLGNHDKAREMYERAIALASEHEYPNEETLARELAARFYADIRHPDLAGLYVRNAYHGYRRWGAIAKLRQMEASYPEYLNYQERRFSDTVTASETTESPLLDLGSILKASQTISGEMVLEKLLRKMMGIIIENAGAQRGMLILEKDGQWRIEAETDSGGRENLIGAPTLLSGSENGEARRLPDSVARYVIRTLEHVVLENASEGDDFANDPYIRRKKTLSLLCMPLVRQGRIIGVLYLENNLTPGAFTPDRVEVLRILSSQAAISLENAMLYTDIENKVKERTRQLNETLDKVEEAHHRIMDSIEYAERIQKSLLPDPEEARRYLPRSFFLWMPRDIVGGDIFFTERFDDGILVVLIDCTGHGVPGAFMSMIASSVLRRLTTAGEYRDPAKLLQQIGRIVRALLRQDRAESLSDDGLEAGACFVPGDGESLIFAGAGIPLFYVREGKAVFVRGDRKALGYKRSNPDFDFRNHHIPIEKETAFYLSSDGFLDQMGKDERSRFGHSSFGRKRFMELIGKIGGLPFGQQEERLLEAFREHKGEMKRQDDVTVVGFGIGR